MKTKTLRWLFMVTFLAWFGPWLAKHLLPNVFGGAGFNWSAAFVASILLSVGMFLSLQSLFSTLEKRREIGWMCLGFVAIFSWTIGTYSLTAPLLTRVDHLIDRLSADKSTLPLVQNLSEESSPEKRMALAQLIYIGSGIAVPYQTEDGTYVVFQPAAKDRDLWRQAQSAEAKIESQRKLIRWTLVQLPYLTLLHIGFFFLAFLIGILRVMYGKEKREPIGACGQ